MAKRIDRKVIRGIIHKYCGRCKTYHPESYFNRRSEVSDNLQNYCRKCNIEYCREWSKRNMGRY